MQFCSIFRSVLRRLPPGKWVTLGHTVEGGSKNSDLFTNVWWHLIRVLPKNADINSDIALSENVVSLREGSDTFVSTHHSLQVPTAASRYYSKYYKELNRIRWSYNYFLNVFYTSPKMMSLFALHPWCASSFPLRRWSLSGSRRRM